MKTVRAMMALMVLVCVVQTVSAQAQSSNSKEGHTELTIAVKKDSVAVGDKLTLYITLKNMHKDRYCHRVVNEEGMAELNGYEIEVTDSKGIILPLLNKKHPRGVSYSGQCLENSKTTSEEMVVNQLVDISQPGVYHIRVSHLDIVSNETVWSNSITLTITQ